MATALEIEKVLQYWNSKGIVVHKRLTHDLELEISRTLKYYDLEDLLGYIDFYATILEPGTPEPQKKYFWTYKWNLWEFLKRGVRKFEGQEPSNYLRKQRVNTPEAIVFTRK